MNAFRVICSVLAVIGGAYVTLGIWVSSLRGHWGGIFTGTPKDAKVGVQEGAISSAGFGFLFISLGLESLGGDAIPKPIAFVLIACTFIAFFLIITGWLLDSRAHDVARGTYRLPGESRTAPEVRHRWVVAICAALLLVVMVLVMVFHG